MPNNALENLKRDLDQKAMEDLEANADNFISSTELDTGEEEKIEQLRTEHGKEVVVSEIGPDGVPVKQSISEFTKALDDKIVVVKTAMDEDKTIKLLNSGEIDRDINRIRQQTQEQALNAYRELSRRDNISDTEIMDMNNRAIASLQKHFNVDRIESDDLTKRMRKMTLAQISGILPIDFMDTYVSRDNIAKNDQKTKEQLLAVIGYLCVTGPEMDYLNEYIESENRLVMVSKKILQCQIDFTEMLKDEAKMSELVERAVKLSPADDSFWSRYIKLPNRVHNEFAQRVVIQEEYKKAYENLLTDPDVLAHEDTIALVKSEIEEADNKIAVYSSICDLTLLKDVASGLFDQYKDQKNLNAKFLMREAVKAVDRVRRSKQDLPFPGYKGNKNNNRPEQILSAYMASYVKMVKSYNDQLLKILKSEQEKENGATATTSVIPIYRSGIPENTVIGYFALVLLIVMGRIVKQMTTNTATKYDAIRLDSYFQMFCKLGTDIYVMTEVWEVLTPIVDLLIDKLEHKPNK